MSNKPRILFVWTRPTPGEGENGRDNIIRNLNNEIIEYYEKYDYYVTSRLKKSNLLFKLSNLLFIFCYALLKSKSFQETLFYDPAQGMKLIGFINKINPEIVVFDTIRSSSYVLLCQKSNCGCKVVVDFDDLMSDRYTRYSHYADRLGLNTGYLEKLLGSTGAFWVSKFPAARWLLKREGRELFQSELQVGNFADLILLTSSLEAHILRQRMLERQEIVVDTPQLFVKLKDIEFPEKPFRFIFVGSDSQLQNRLVIDYLCNLWLSYSPQVELFIYGRQNRYYESIDNVIFCGFEPDYKSIYTSCSIALVPAIIEGGVKTKVIESLAYGVPVVTNRIGIQGMPFENLNIGLDFDEAELINVINNPELYLDLLCANSRAAQNILNELWGRHAYKQKVKQLFGSLL